MLTYTKALTENLPLSNAAESRWLVQTGADGLGDLIPESVLPKRKPVVKPGFPRYRDRTCWSPMSDLLWR